MISVVPVDIERVGSSDQWKVLGSKNSENHTYDAPPAPLTKDLIVTLEQGKFPLTDHTDCFPHSKHRYILRFGDQRRVVILNGFTYNCMPVGFGTGGSQNVTVLVQVPVVAGANTTNETNQNNQNNYYSSITEADFAL
uniref:Uncharacterized protein n=1 Tax=viral metagenome TaxID=1070528 RepID=A0A6C0APG1_9ZZZZ